MVKPRRARPRVGRMVAIGAASAALVGGGVAVAWDATRGHSSASSSTTVSTSTSPSASASSPSASASPTPSAPVTGTAALQGCQQRVRAADAVLDAAKTGVRHWREHVEAQTDANSGKVTIAQMDGIFKRTRLDGPSDVAGYTSALSDYSSQHGSCSPVAGAPTSVANALDQCHRRDQAQQPVLSAAGDAMADWKSHLATMQHSKMGEVHDAQAVWIRTWEAAPPHIHAYDRAVANFSAPSC